jgi:hypothetical protein
MARFHLVSCSLSLPGYFPLVFSAELLKSRSKTWLKAFGIILDFGGINLLNGLMQANSFLS